MDSIVKALGESYGWKKKQQYKTDEMEERFMRLLNLRKVQFASHLSSSVMTSPFLYRRPLN